MVARLGAGDFFGELAPLDPAPRAATVVAGPDTEVAVLGARMFHVLLREFPTIGTALLAALARQVRAGGSLDATEDAVAVPGVAGRAADRVER